MNALRHLNLWFLFLLQVCDWTSGRRKVGFMLCDSVICRLSQVMESSDDDPAYVVKFKSTFRTDLETRKQNANIVYVKTAAALEPDSRSSSVYPDLTEPTEGTEGCWRETCGSSNIRATRGTVGPIGVSSECEQEEDSAENSVVDTEQSPPSVQRPVH